MREEMGMYTKFCNGGEGEREKKLYIEIKRNLSA